MAIIVNATPGVKQANQLISAIQMIRGGIGKLQELDMLRAEAIGEGQSKMAAVFGISTDAEAQALSDRWSALLSAYEDGANAEYAKLRDMINAFVS